MATVPKLPPVPVDDYFDSNYWAEFEYDNGILASRNAGSPDHSLMIARLVECLAQHRLHLRTFVGLVLRIRNTKYRVPDVCCYAATVDPGEALEGQPPPLVIFEVLSKTDPLSGMQEKCEEYRRLGVHSVFIVDPAHGAVLIPQGKVFPAVAASISIPAGGGVSISIPLAELFAGFAAGQDH